MGGKHRYTEPMSHNEQAVEEYLQSLPEDRQAALREVRKVVRENLDSVFEEGIQYKMIGYYVPHSVYPKGYHCDPKQPLPLAALGNNKGYMSLHAMHVYGNPELTSWLHEAFAKAGKKLDMGQACIRFKKLADLPLDVIAELFRKVTAESYIARIEAVVQSRPVKSKKQA